MILLNKVYLLNGEESRLKFFKWAKQDYSEAYACVIIRNKALELEDMDVCQGKMTADLFQHSATGMDFK